MACRFLTRLEPANPDFPVFRLRPGQRLDYFGKVIGVVRKLGVRRQLHGADGRVSRSDGRDQRDAAVDRINRQFGKGSVRSASEGLKSQKPLWTMHREKLSGVSTTNWSQLPVAR